MEASRIFRELDAGGKGEPDRDGRRGNTELFAAETVNSDRDPAGSGPRVSVLQRSGPRIRILRGVLGFGSLPDDESRGTAAAVAGQIHGCVGQEPKSGRGWPRGFRRPEAVWKCNRRLFAPANFYDGRGQNGAGRCD
jgi:hypothetical protein